MADHPLDSCVLIRHLRRHQLTMDLFAALVLEGNVGIAAITRTEIIEGMRDHERERTLRLLDSLPAFPLDSATANLAGEFIRRYRHQGLILDRPDAIIGATAVQGRCILVTYKRAHFPMPELALYGPILQSRVAGI